MTGILCSILGAGGSSAVNFAVAVGSNGWSYKGIYGTSYGYDAASTYPTGSPPPSPTLFKGETVCVITCYDTNASAPAVNFGVTGMNTALSVTKVRMNGVDYTMGAATQSFYVSNTTTITNLGGYIVVNWNGHGLVQGDMVYFTTTGTLPSGLSPNTPYYVQTPSTNYFYLATTPAGAIMSYTTGGTGTHTTYQKPYVNWASTTSPSGNATGGRTPFGPTISFGSPGVVTYTSHGLTNGKRVAFRTTGTLPGGLSPNTIYYVVNAAANTFNLSATLGGSAINTTSAGSGFHTCFEVVDVTVT